jgi:hypothetical protein
MIYGDLEKTLMFKALSHTMKPNTVQHFYMLTLANYANLTNQ